MNLGPAKDYVLLLLLIFGLCTSVTGNTGINSTSGLTLVIGVYGPAGGVWREVVEDTWRNMDPKVIHLSRLEVTLVTMETDYNLSYSDITAARTQLKASEISIIIGPENEALSLAAYDLRIPYVILSPPMTSSIASSNGGHTRGRGFHMWPEMTLHHLAVCDVVMAYRWTQAAVLYMDETGLHLVGELMTIPTLEVRSYRLEADDVTISIRQYLLHIRQLNIRQIIVMTTIDVVNTILSEALRLSMMSNYYNWLLPDLMSSDLDLTLYNYTQVNMTVFTLGKALKKPEVGLRTRLTHDALSLIMRAASSFTARLSKACLSPQCKHSRVVGAEILPYLTKTHIEGQTGWVRFGFLHGYRTDINLELLTLREYGLSRKGEWTSSGYTLNSRLMLDVESGRPRHSGPHPLGKEPLNIVIMQDAPFVMLRKNAASYQGNGKYEGFLVDLIEQISQKLKFEYVFYESPDGNYGSQQEGEWNGMIRELIIGNASMCLGAISITSERETAIDFTKPFMQKTFNILIKKPLEKTSPFQFLWPFSAQIWTVSLAVLLLVSLLLFLMDRFSPNFEETRFTLYESVWFIYGSLVGAGAEMFPRTLSSRILSAAWWFFSLILVSSYTANLAAFLTVTRIETPIKTIMDLASQTQIKYGTVRDTYAHSFFRTSKLDEIKKMWTYMNEVYPDTMVENTSVGISKVKEGDYAFIWDAPINRYTAMYECDTLAVGEPFDEKGLGIGVPLGAPYRDDLTMAILNLQEAGVTQKLIERWWGSGKCGAFQETSTSRTKELDMPNIAGVFLVLAGGAAVALFACVIEVSYRRFRKRKNCKKRTLNPTEQECPIHMTELSHTNSYQNR